MEILKGILLSKTPFQERHIIGRVLLTSGELANVIFYGGRGGGKKQKPSTLELGTCLEIKTKLGGKRSSDLLTASSWKSVWFYEKLRLNYEAYYLLCFYVELCQKLATDLDVDNFKKYGVGEDNGLFNVLSNGLFYLENSVKEEVFDRQAHLSLFLIKLLFTQGVAPEITACLFCEEVFNVSGFALFQIDKGGFLCSSCAPPELKNMEVSDSSLLTLMKKVWPLKYAQYKEVGKVDSLIVQSLYKYFCYQFQFEPQGFKTSPYVF